MSINIYCKNNETAPNISLNIEHLVLKNIPSYCIHIQHYPIPPA